MAGIPTPDQADGLLAAGAITPEQHQQIVQSQPAAAPNFNAPMPIDNSWVGGASAPTPTPTPAPMAFDPSVAHSAPVDVINPLPASAAIPSSTLAPPPSASDAPVGPPTAPSPSAAPVTRPGPSSAAPVPSGPYVNDQESVSEGGGIPSPGKPASSGFSAEVDRRAAKVNAQAAEVTAEQRKLEQMERDELQRKVDEAEYVAKQRVMEDAIKQGAEATRLQREADRQAKFLSAVAERDQASKDAANSRIEQEKLFDSPKSFLTGIASAIAIGAGAYAAAMTKSPNYALQIIDENIKRDIDRQKFAINQKWKKVDGMTNALQEQRQIMGDQRLGDLAWTAHAQGIAADEIARYKANTLSADAQGRLDILEQKQRAAQAATQYELKSGIEQQVKKEQAAAAAAQGANVAAVKKTYEENLKIYKGDRAQAIAATEDIYGPDSVGKVLKGSGAIDRSKSASANLNEDQQKDLKDLSRDMTKAGVPEGRQLLGEAKEHLATPVSGLGVISQGMAKGVAPTAAIGLATDPEAVAQGQVVLRLVGQVLKQDSGAAATDAEVARKYVEVIGDGSPEAVKRGLTQLENQLNAKESGIARGYHPNVVKSYGGQPSKPDEAASGNLAADKARADKAGITNSGK